MLLRFARNGIKHALVALVLFFQKRKVPLVESDAGVRCTNKRHNKFRVPG